MREIAKIHDGDFRLTANQNLIIANVSPAKRPEIEKLLEQYGIKDSHLKSALRLNSLACVALPTCGLSLAEAERYLPDLLTELEEVIEENGLRHDAITIRMTGCPNGCARPFIAEIAFVGRAPGKYNVYLGGGFAGQRLSKLYRESVQAEDIKPLLAPIIARYAKERERGRALRRFLHPRRLRRRHRPGQGLPPEHQAGGPQGLNNTAMQALKFHAEPDFDPEILSADIAPLRAGERIRLLHERLGDHLVATTSFGLQAAVMLHLIHEHAPKIPVVFIDTGFLFPETYRYVEQLIRLPGQTRPPRLSAQPFPPPACRRCGEISGKTARRIADRYAMLTKIEPMNRALRETGADVWLSGLRRSQSQTRSDRPFVERQKKTLKAYPILDWADAQVDLYFHQHDLPRHPLAEQGYLTMGDWHSTRPVEEARPNPPASTARNTSAAFISTPDLGFPDLRLERWHCWRTARWHGRGAFMLNAECAGHSVHGRRMSVNSRQHVGALDLQQPLLSRFIDRNHARVPFRSRIQTHHVLHQPTHLPAANRPHVLRDERRAHDFSTTGQG